MCNTIHNDRITNKSFGRRVGKKISKTQSNILENVLNKYLISLDNLNTKGYSNYQECIVEIGIGMGDHLINLALKNPDAIIIGFEPYLNGIANTIKLVEQFNIQNIVIWPDDMNSIFYKIHDCTIDSIYVLFPDPWPKTKHRKRRIITSDRMLQFAQKLKKGGNFYFATDIIEYFNSALKQLDGNVFHLINASNKEFNGYTPTKYHKKALATSSREINFIHANKI